MHFVLYTHTHVSREMAAGRVGWGYRDFGVCGENFEFFEELNDGFCRVDEVSVDDLSICEELGMIESILM